jgi:hypothetical protein
MVSLRGKEGDNQVPAKIRLDSILKSAMQRVEGCSKSRRNWDGNIEDWKTKQNGVFLTWEWLSS